MVRALEAYAAQPPVPIFVYIDGVRLDQVGTLFDIVVELPKAIGLPLHLLVWRLRLAVIWQTCYVLAPTMQLRRVLQHALSDLHHPHQNQGRPRCSTG